MSSHLETWLACADWTGRELVEEGLEPGACEEALDSLVTICRDAWLTGIMRGFNGNMSVRVQAGERSLFLVTGTGVAKGHLRMADIGLADAEGRLLHGRALSSETAMHMEIYRRRPEAVSVLHVHPAALLALSLKLQDRMEDFLALPLFESGMWRAKLGFAPACEPGTGDLALAVGRAFAGRDIQAVFMAGHGLCALGTTPVEALGVCEQLEHLAATQLLLLGA